MEGLWPGPTEAASTGETPSPSWWQSEPNEWVLSGDGITAVVRRLSERHWSSEISVEAPGTYQTQEAAQRAAQVALGRLCIRQDPTLAAEF